MKKLVLIAVWATILTVFLAFNYLLWERENPSTVEGTKSPVKDTVSELNTAIKRLEEANVKLEKEKELATAYNNQYLEQIRLKNILIYELKRMADLSSLEDIIRLWVDSVSSNDYKKAFKLFSNRMVYGPDTQLRMRDYFQNYEVIIQSMKVKSIELDLQHTEKGKNGEVIFKAVIDVKHKASDNKMTFVEGLNTRYFVMIYDDITEDWFIDGIVEKLDTDEQKK